MSNEAKGILAGALLAGVTVALFFAVPGAEPGRAQAQGVRWESIGVDDALARAGAEGTRVLLEFDAAWCSVCKTLDRELLATRRGAALTRDLVAVRLDFDAEENRPLVERYVVLGLPTVLVLTPEGTQVGRLQGYEDAERWAAELVAAKTADDPVPALRETLAARPNDATAALRLGEALLVRGVPEEGEALLERATWMGGEGAPEAAAEALFVMGRYHHRVRRDPATARHLWRELAARFPESEWASGAWWWYAKAEAERGRHDVGLEALRARVRAEPASTAALVQWAEYLADHDLRWDRLDARDALERALASAEGEERRELEQLLGRLSR